MNSNILTLIALLVIAAGGYLIYFIYSRVQQRKHEALYSPKKFEAWMATQEFNMSFGEYVGALIDRAEGRPNKLDGMHQEALRLERTGP